MCERRRQTDIHGLVCYGGDVDTDSVHQGAGMYRGRYAAQARGYAGEVSGRAPI